jgi:DNA-binding CsgD family transcriptional regulator
MNIAPFSRALAVTIGALAALNTVQGLTLPAAARRPPAGVVLLWLALLAAHAALYWCGARLRRRAGSGVYLVLQASLAFAFGATGAPFGATLGVFVGLTAEAVLLSRGRWSGVAITTVSIGVFSAAAMIGSTLYQGAGAGVVLAAAGIVAHSSAALLRGRERAVERDAEREAERAAERARDAAAAAQDEGRATTQAPSIVPSFVPSRVSMDFEALGLTGRERDVLRVLSGGARTSDIARELGIAERTVKVHLSRIYQKLGVTSRAEAIARIAQGRTRRG